MDRRASMRQQTQIYSYMNHLIGDELFQLSPAHINIHRFLHPVIHIFESNGATRCVIALSYDLAFVYIEIYKQNATV